MALEVRLRYPNESSMAVCVLKNPLQHIPMAVNTAMALPFRRPSAKQWIIKHRLSPRDKQAITRMLEKEGHRVLELGRIGTVYDVEEQNVCFSVPLNKYTIETDPNQIRQLIFFQDGHLRYEWEMPGGNLL